MGQKICETNGKVLNSNQSILLSKIPKNSDLHPSHLSVKLGVLQVPIISFLYSYTKGLQ